MEERVPGKWRKFSPEFKEKALERMEGCSNVTALAKELGIRRKWLYAWREAKKSALAAVRIPTEAEADSRDGKIVALEKQVAELQRSLGQKCLEIDFFGKALRRIEETRRSSREFGGNTSTPKSGAWCGRKAN
jgi:transposase-like protein